MSTKVKVLKVGQLVRVKTSVKDESGKTVVAHGCRGFVLTGSADDGSCRVQFPTRVVSLSGVDVASSLVTLKGRPRKVVNDVAPVESDTPDAE